MQESVGLRKINSKYAHQISVTSFFVVFLSLFSLSLCFFYFFNYEKFEEQYKGFMGNFENLTESYAQIFSYGFFQWTEMLESIDSGNLTLFEINKKEILDQFPAVKSIEIADRAKCSLNTSKDFLFVSEGESLFVFINIYDDSKDKVNLNKIIRVQFVLDILLKKINAYEYIFFSEKGNLNFSYNMNTIRKIPLLTFFHIFSSLCLGILGVFLYRSLIVKEIRNHYRTAGLERIVFLFEQKDKYSANHSRNVSIIAYFLGGRLNLRKKDLENLKIASLLHDIGKMKIPEQLLNKPGKLTSEEFEIIKSHSKIGAEILMIFPELKHLSRIILYHHEKTDGTGYPEGLKEEQIPYLSKIIAISDIFEALISDRIYRRGISPEKALQMLYKMPVDKNILKILSNSYTEILKDLLKE